MPERKNFSVLPASEWGSAFGGFVVAPLGHHVLLYVPDPEEAKTFRRIHRVQRLPDSIMPDNVKTTSDLEEAIEHADVLVEAAKSQSFRRRYKEQVPHLQRLKKQPIRLNLSKGLEQGSHLRMSQIILQEDKGANDYIASLAGPTLAKEIAGGALAGAAVGSDNERTRNSIQLWLNNPRFRIDTSNDLIGVELGGALKNVYALGAGIIYEYEYERQCSTKALYLTRALEEMTRIGTALGAHPLTFMSLANLGDLALSFDDYGGGATRNFRAGVLLAKGSSISEIINLLGTVEGLDTLESVKALAEAKNIPVPMINTIDGVYKGTLEIKTAVNLLLGQQFIKEQNGDKGLIFYLTIQGRRLRHNLGGLFSEISRISD